MHLLIVSAPRCGTKFTAAFFTALGIPTLHESAFNVRNDVPDWKQEQGCSSWLSAPFLDHAPPELMILHQWRDFEASGASLERHCFFDRPHDEYATFANKYVRIPGPPHEGVKFIRKWHRLIQEKLQGRTHFSYAVENLDVALGVRICRYLGHDPDDEQRAWARGIPRNLHTNIPASNSPEGMDVPIWPESEV